MLTVKNKKHLKEAYKKQKKRTKRMARFVGAGRCVFGVCVFIICRQGCYLTD